MILVDMSSLETVEIGPVLSSRIEGQVMIAGRRFHPLTPETWANIYAAMRRACSSGQYEALRPILRRWMDVTELAEKQHGPDALREAVRKKIANQQEARN